VLGLCFFVSVKVAQLEQAAFVAEGPTVRQFVLVLFYVHALVQNRLTQTRPPPFLISITHALCVIRLMVAQLAQLAFVAEGPTVRQFLVVWWCYFIYMLKYRIVSNTKTPSSLLSFRNARPAIDYRIVPGSFPNPVVSVGVCYTLVGRCRKRLDHGMVGYCVGVLLFTSFACVIRLKVAQLAQPAFVAEGPTVRQFLVVIFYIHALVQDRL